MTDPELVEQIAQVLAAKWAITVNHEGYSWERLSDAFKKSFRSDAEALLPLLASREAAAADKAEIDRLIEALEPFADALGDDDDDEPDHTQGTLAIGRSLIYSLDLGDFRRARSAMNDAIESGSFRTLRPARGL